MTAPLASATGTRLPLAPIFIVSLVAVGFEIALTRYFAMANWSEYGYWVISITMVGFATSGVVLSLFETWFAPRANPLLSLIPVLLILAGALGYHLVALNPFNPLELQNPLLYKGQLVNIAKYYGALFPYYFLTGLYIGLSFLRFQDRIPAVYGADLAGAGLGAGAVLLLMFLVHPFYLLVWLLPLLPLAVWLFPWYGGTGPRWRLWAPLTALLGAELLLLGFNPAEYNTYKAIYPALNVENNRVLTSVRSPRGYFQVLDNFTERLDTDFSNNIGMLRLPGPPATLGVYRDGNRIGSLPKAETGDPRYAEGALDAGPYRLLNQPSVLLVGTRGGFRVAEALHLGARSVTALEPDVTLRTLVTQGINGAPHPSLQALSVRVSGKAPADLLNSSGDRFELIDISSDYLGQSFANRFVFTREAVALMLDRLAGDGVLSLPVSIQEFTLYGVKLLETVRSALSQAGYDRPEEHITVFRSAWNVRILASPQPFTPARLQPLLEFCNERSFDVSYYPGMDPAGLEVWNDLPQVSFEEERVLPSAPGGSDALREQALAILGSGRDAFLKRHFFDLSPATHDRPYFHYILRPEKLGAVLKRIMLLPREEIGYLVNIAVLAQSLVLAVLVMFLPLLRWRRRLPGAGVILRAILYFAALGLGFLFVEMLLIEKVSYLLNDQTSAFGVVLAGMLVFSGVGSYFSARYQNRPRHGVRMAALFVVGWCLAAWAGLDGLFELLMGFPMLLKVAAVVVLMAPVSVALGVPFPLGLQAFRGERAAFLPWAWSLNGAFSVIATPLATLLSVYSGFSLLLAGAAALYLMVSLLYPAAEGA